MTKQFVLKRVVRTIFGITENDISTNYVDDIHFANFFSMYLFTKIIGWPNQTCILNMANFVSQIDPTLIH